MEIIVPLLKNLAISELPERNRKASSAIEWLFF
jgi:hypothetical protein